MAFNKVGDEIDFGSNGAFNINTTTAKGLEKAIGIVGRFTINAQAATNEVLYGKWKLQNQEGKGVAKILDRGLLNATEKFASVDYCRLFTTLLDQVNIPQFKFDPKKSPPENASPFEKRLWSIQKKANEYEKYIDKFYKQYGTTTGPDSSLGLKELVQQFNLLFEELTGPNGLGDRELVKEFPETTQLSNYIQNVQVKFQAYTDVRLIPVQEIQDILRYVDGTRQILRAIQALNNPQYLIAIVNRLGGDAISDLTSELDKSINPEKLADFIESMLKEADKLVNIAKKIASYINLGRTLVRVMLLLIKVFVVLIAAIDFVALAIPAIFTTTGTPVKFSTIKEDILKNKGLQKFIKRLNQISLTLGLMASFVNTLVFAMNNIIGKFNLILINLRGCSRQPDDLVNGIENTIRNLEDAKRPLQEFLDGINNANKADKVRFGSYTISIIKEEVTDEGISLRRRYGIAVGNDGKIYAQSTPTFASLDEIIINEVKVQLISKGLVAESLTALSTQDLLTVVDSMKFLGEEGQDIDMNFSISAPEEQDEDLKEFVDNLPGGRALRIRARKKLIRENQKITKELQKTDPNGTYSKKIIKQKDQENIKLQIANLEDEKKGLKIKIIAAAAIPGAQVALIPLIKRVKEIDEEIELLKSGKTPKPLTINGRAIRNQEPQ